MPSAEESRHVDSAGLVGPESMSDCERRASEHRAKKLSFRFIGVITHDMRPHDIARVETRGLRTPAHK